MAYLIACALVYPESEQNCSRLQTCKSGSLAIAAPSRPAICRHVGLRAGFARPWQFRSRGRIDYIGQLEDDLADFVAVLPLHHPNDGLSLIGFSAGGGFVLRVISTADEKLFNRFIMISPALPPGAPTIRPDTGGWVSVAKPRIIVLAILNRLGIGWFNGLPIVAFATSHQGSESHQRLFISACGRFRRRRAIISQRSATATKPAALPVGGGHELFFSRPLRTVVEAGAARSEDHDGAQYRHDSDAGGHCRRAKSFLGLTAPAIAN
jgi:serine aminopeptidase S33 family